MFPYVFQPHETLQLVQIQNLLSGKQKCLPTNSEAFWWREQFHMFRRFLRHFQHEKHEKHGLPARSGLHKQIVTATPHEYIRLTYKYIRVTYRYIRATYKIVKNYTEM